MNEKSDAVNEKFDAVNEKFDEVNKRFDTLEAKIDQKADKTDIVRLENEHGQKLDVLFDGYTQIYEKLKEHDKRFDEQDKRFERIEMNLVTLSQKVSSHDSKLEVLEELVFNPFPDSPSKS